ncbi:uncharacterized protein B0H18DRAFT_1214164 [Fomitopsis serialis]|uniref:uncharacterized protein n=1 Tax=Fomitopsis serialis TaxID=139415 RepID=UPI00200864F7|nr:uncharacterized protein B0H18DRAFT_1214164 [Neoantrodia serialis]KAH9918477.1 hypothetical protein B0H18DRAFT_1214164 [Neoantrodia serialis]
MPAFAITLQYVGLNAEFFRLHKSRSRSFPKAFVKDNLKSLELPLPRMLYLLDWQAARVMCYWKMMGDVGDIFIDGIRRQVDVVRANAALLETLEICEITEVPASPLPPTLIPGVPDTFHLARKRRAQPSSEPSQAKKARVEQVPPATASAQPTTDSNIAGQNPDMSTGTRAPLASVTNASSRVSVVPVKPESGTDSALPEALPGALAGSAPAKTSVTRVITAQGPVHPFVKGEPPNDRALLQATVDSGNNTTGNARPSIKAEPGRGPRRDLQDKDRALRRKIRETYDRDVKLIAENTRLKQEVERTKCRIERLKAKSYDVRMERPQANW